MALSVPTVVPNSITSSRGKVSQVHYVAVLTAYGYVPVQLTSVRLRNAFTASLSDNKIMCTAVAAEELTAWLTNANADVNSVVNSVVNFWLGLNNVVPNQLVAIFKLIPKSCQNLEFNKLPLNLPAPVATAPNNSTPKISASSSFSSANLKR